MGRVVKASSMQPPAHGHRSTWVWGDVLAFWGLAGEVLDQEGPALHVGALIVVAGCGLLAVGNRT